jgi:hypothetical protein
VYYIDTLWMVGPDILVLATLSPVIKSESCNSTPSYVCLRRSGVLLMTLRHWLTKFISIVLLPFALYNFPSSIPQCTLCYWNKWNLLIFFFVFCNVCTESHNQAGHRNSLVGVVEWTPPTQLARPRTGASTWYDQEHRNSPVDMDISNSTHQT